MRERFFAIVIRRTRELARQHDKLVVAQAISKHTYRLRLAEAFPEAVFIHVDAGKELRARRLMQRGDAVTPDWVDKLLAQQEPPGPGHLRLDNNHDCSHLAQQMTTLLNPCYSNAQKH